MQLCIVVAGQGRARAYKAKAENFMAKKRKAAMAQIEREKENGVLDEGKKDKANIWMQCDKCKYTTNYNAFMIHHIRQHVKKKNRPCDFCGSEVKPGTACATGRCDAAGVPGTSGTSNAKKTPVSDAGSYAARRETKTPDMVISAVERTSCGAKSLDDENNLAGEAGMMGSISDMGDPDSNPGLIDVPGGGMSLSEVHDKDDITIEVSNVNQESVAGSTSICLMEMSGQEQPPTLLTVQKMEEEDDSNAVYVQVVEVGKGGTGEGGSLTKQVLTVADDGTVEMVEVMWDDMSPPGKDLIERVREKTADKTWVVECGFMPGRGCMYQIFSLKQVIEKCMESKAAADLQDNKNPAYVINTKKPFHQMFANDVITKENSHFPPGN
uniref:Uncharacterized protein n=1 Tax=Timema cristinae TaxID=61476 RepID=A0A7R9CY71_TIMCR|nr:unnamed protein product [Timema cristinae]